MKLNIPIKVVFDDVNNMIDELGKLKKYKLHKDDDMTLVDVDDVVDVLVKYVKVRDAKELPSTQPKNGKWIRHDEIKNVYGGICIECSECGENYVVQYIDYEKYCRNCGAKMEDK